MVLVNGYVRVAIAGVIAILIIRVNAWFILSGLPEH
tara:strand:+ start:468 stop:575 length:108 start_codon:yes stop_codon:yes gene_type:complete